MHRKALFFLIWFFLFGATVAIRAVASGSAKPPATVDQSRSAADADIAEELESKPRKNALSFSDSDESFDHRLGEVVLKNSQELRSCKRRLTAKLQRVKEYFEVSFVPVPDAATGVVTLTDVVLERSTLPMTSDEERCIVDAFGRVRVPVADAGTARKFYRFCFSGPAGN